VTLHENLFSAFFGPGTKDFGALSRRPCSHGFPETELQLRVYFISDGHHVEQHGAEIHAAKIVLHSIQDANLRD
jgi:hypothetical protein